MADLKISDLVAATTPLAGSELVPIVQSGATKRVTIAQLASSLTSLGTLSSLAVSGNAMLGSGTANARVDAVSTAYAAFAARASTAGAGQTVDALKAVDSNAAFFANAAYSALSHTWNVSGSTAAWQMNASGHFLAATDATYDIGASGANRPRNVYASGSGLFGSSINVNTAGTATSGFYNGVAISGYDALGWSGSNTLALGGYRASQWGQIDLYTGGTLKATLDGSGNLGLGVTPSAWKSDWKAFDVTSGGIALAGSLAAGAVATNAFLNASAQWIYKSTFAASRYSQNSDGSHSWFTAPSGTAGTAITFTQAMTLDASGNLGVGTTSALVRLHSATSGNTPIIAESTGGTLAYVNLRNTAGMAYIGSSGDALVFAAGSSATVRWNMNSAGHFIAGTDATYDIGASGANRPRDYYGSGNGILGGYLRVSAASAGAASTTTIGSTTATTVGAAGGASALPATPLGYIIAHVGTTQVKIPYYNV